MIGVYFVFALISATNCGPVRPYRRNVEIEPVDLKFYCTPGDKRMTPVLFIHGLSSSRKTWDGLMENLNKITGRMVCAVDLRNHGESPWNDKSDVDTMAMDIVHFLKSRGFTKVNLIGHSLGGKIAVHVTLNNPELVESLVVEDMRPNGITKEAMAYVQMYLNIQNDAIKKVPTYSTENEAKNFIVDYMNKLLTELGMPQTRDDKTATKLSIRCRKGSCGYNFNMDLIQKAMEKAEEIMGESKGIFRGPVLFIYGKSSPFKLADDKTNILRHFPNATFIGVKGAGHQIHRKFKRTFMNAVVSFLNAAQRRI